MGKVSASQHRAAEKYNRAHYDNMQIRVPKGDRERYMNAAHSAGYRSLRRFVIDAIEEHIKRTRPS